MNRAELMYKWGLFKHYRRMHGAWWALRFTFGRYYVMPADRAPSADEIQVNEEERYKRSLLRVERTVVLEDDPAYRQALKRFAHEVAHHAHCMNINVSGDPRTCRCQLWTKDDTQ